MKKHYQWNIGAEPPPIEEHSIRKHEILKEYLIYYLEIVTQHPMIKDFPLTVIDGFSGGGAYSYGGEIVDGSPLIILDAMKEAELKINLSRNEGNITNKIKIHPNFFFIEKEKSTFEYLQSLLGDRGYDSNKSTL